MRTAFLSVVFLAATAARADTLTYTVTPVGGQYQYQFALSNTGATGGSLFDLFLAIPLDIASVDTGEIGTPAGWGDANGGLLFFGPDANPATSFIQWSADFSGVFDLPIGSSLSGYAFTATDRTTSQILFAVNGSLDVVPAEESTSAIPEPGVMGLLLVGLTTTIALQKTVWVSRGCNN